MGFGLRRSAVGTRTFGVCATEKLGGVPLIHTQAAFTQTGTYGTPRLSKGTGRRGPLRVAGRAAAASPTTGRMAQRPAFGGPGGGLSQHGARSSRWARLRHSLVLFGFLGRKGPRSAAEWSLRPGNEVFALQGRTGTGQCPVVAAFDWLRSGSVTETSLPDFPFFSPVSGWPGDISGRPRPNAERSMLGAGEETSRANDAGFGAGRSGAVGDSG